MSTRPLVARALGLALGACGCIGLAACSSSGNAATPTTLPPLPPSVLGYVTTIGAGSTEGAGAHVVSIDFSATDETVPESIATGTFPAAVAVSVRLHDAYVANYASNTITPISLRTNVAGKPIPAGSGPAGIAIAPNGTTAYVTDAGSTPIGDTVTVIDLRHKKDVATIKVGAGPEGIAVTPDGKTAYVTDSGAIVTGQSGAIGDTVTPIDLADDKALSPVTVGNAPEAVTISSDGSTAYVANANSESVSPIDVATNTAGTPIGLGGSPQALAMSTDGSTLWTAVAVAKSGNLTPIDVASGTAGKPVSVPANPTGVAISGESAYVVSYGADTVVTVDLDGKSLLPGGSVSVPGGPYAIALASVPQAEVPKALSPHHSKKTKEKKKK